jgi:DNA-binding transcriptional MerR regulator
MFRIGEFAQIAQVSGRQLRFYDQLGLLQPAHTDPQTGYRYYSIRQLPRLNSILALKELGLSLEQIGPLLKNEISPTELRGMLTMKRTQVEQSLRDEEIRLRHIESRIAQIDRQGGLRDYDVVMKSIAATPFLSLQCNCENMDEVVRMVRAVAEGGAREIKPGLRDKLIVVAANDRDDERLELEIGYSLTRPSNQPKVFQYLDSQIEGKFLVGSALSLADIGIASNLINFQYLGFAVDRAKYPKLASYAAGIVDLEPFKQALAKEAPFAENLGLDRGFLR